MVTKYVVGWDDERCGKILFCPEKTQRLENDRINTISYNTVWSEL